MSQITRVYEDRLFDFIIGREVNKTWTRILYNAVNGTHYSYHSEIQDTDYL